MIIMVIRIVIIINIMIVIVMIIMTIMIMIIVIIIMFMIMIIFTLMLSCLTDSSIYTLGLLQKKFWDSILNLFQENNQLISKVVSRR